MNSLFAVGFVATVAYAFPSGHGTIVAGQSGVVTGHGAIGPVGYGSGNGNGNGINGWGVGNGYGAINNWGLGYGHGVAAITAGHGSISASAHGAAIRGPQTAPVVVAGPAGKIVADGLWGPTANIGGYGAHGAVGYISYARGHGWW